MRPLNPLVMGILNCTPDSFSDGGKFLTKDSAFKWAEELIAQGTDIIDIGGESTRPGAVPVSLDEEMNRVLPVIEMLHKACGVKLSIDTTKYEVAKEAVALGATIVNDVSGGSDIRLVSLLVDNPGVTLVLMHRKGTPENMQKNPEYPNGVVSEVREFLAGRVRSFIEAGVAKSQLWVDPGIGFGKTLNHNLDLLRHVKNFTDLGERVLIGTSRKSFLGQILDSSSVMEDRLPGTIASNLWALRNGATVFRVHGVKATKSAIKTWEAIQTGFNSNHV